MTKEITKAIILQEIQDKFQLREFDPAKFLFDETVVPVYEINSHLQKWRSNRYTITITGTGVAPVKNIPENERWTLRAYTPVFLTGAFTIAGMYILRKLRKDSSDFSYLDLTAAQNTSYLRTLPEPVVLEPGDSLNLNVDGYTTTGNIAIHIDYMKEEIR